MPKPLRPSRKPSARIVRGTARNLATLAAHVSTRLPRAWYFSATDIELTVNAVVLLRVAFVHLAGTSSPADLRAHLAARPDSVVIASDIKPLVDRALSGERVYLENLHLVMTRNGYPEDTYWTFSYSPLRDGDKIEGMLVALASYIGGIYEQFERNQTNKVPFLGDLPGVGVLFRATSESRVKRNLLVFLQPTILRDAASAAALTQKQYASVRRIDLGLDQEGRLTRLPSNIQDIYQGGTQRDGRRAAPASAPVPTAAPAASVEPMPAAAPAPTARTPTIVTDENSPRVYAAESAAAIKAESLPMTPAQVEAQALQPQPSRPAAASSATSAPRSTPSTYVPPSTAADPEARPFTAVSPDPVTTAYAPAAAQAPRETTTAETIPATNAETFAPQVKPFVPETASAAESARKPAARKTSKKTAEPDAATARPGMRTIRTSSGSVYYVPENPPEPTSTP